jgi:tyrosyl-tRNA synthetase
LLDEETLSYNVGRIKEQLGRVVDLTDAEKGQLVDNRDWTQPITVLEFLRDVGKYVTVNQMLARESVKVRIDSEHGISFTEFSYMLLQANDYLWLHDNLGCTIQVGGSDQWGNILSGVDFIRRKRQHQVHAFCWPLMTASDGTKLGKTTGARVWLDADKTSPYQLRQYFMQTADADIEQQLLTFSLRSVDEIRDIAGRHAESPQLRLGQKTLADDMVALVHGADAMAAANEAADLLFSSDPTGASEQAFETLVNEIPYTQMSAGELHDPIAVFVATELAKSNGDARRTMDQNAYYANGVQLGEKDQLTGQKLLHGRFLLLRKGKKSHHLVEITR